MNSQACGSQHVSVVEHAKEAAHANDGADCVCVQIKFADAVAVLLVCVCDEQVSEKKNNNHQPIALNRVSDKQVRIVWRKRQIGGSAELRYRECSTISASVGACASQCLRSPCGGGG